MSQAIVGRSKFMNLRKNILIASLVTGLSTLSAAQAQEKKIKREELPPAVEKTVAQESKGRRFKDSRRSWKTGRGFTKSNSK
jgi:hypothetical protein